MSLRNPTTFTRFNQIARQFLKSYKEEKGKEVIQDER
jgi:hypothetical protein